MCQSHERVVAQLESAGTASTIARCIHALVPVLFALNRRHLLNDKTALQEISAFAVCPDDFRRRVEALLSKVGASRASLEQSVDLAQHLFREVAGLCAGIYSPKYDLPG